MTPAILSFDGSADFLAFATPGQTLPAGNVPQECFDLQYPARRGKLLLTLTVGAAGRLDTFYISRASVLGGAAVIWKSGSDFLTPTRQQPETLGYTFPVPAGTSFQLLVDMEGVAEMQIWAGSVAGTTLQLEVGAPD